MLNLRVSVGLFCIAFIVIGSGVVLSQSYPAKTPAPVINRLNQEIVRVLHLPDMKEKLSNAGVETVGSSPEGLPILSGPKWRGWAR